jgi:mannan endo-1,4-beta-mannosidase
VSLPATTEWTTVSAGQVLLDAGVNTVEVQNNWGWYLIDAISLSPSAKRPAHQVSTTPVNSNANKDAKALLRYLGNVYGKGILSGQQDQASLEWVESNVGKTPAILGLDLMDYTQSRIERGASSQDVEHALKFDKRSGIVTFVWHWGAPTGLYDTEDHRWWSGFYTDATDFDIEAALADTSNANYTLLMRDIDTIAVQLKRLQDAGVPVLWRPLHEAEGKWFWWGAKGPEACKKCMYMMMKLVVVGLMIASMAYPIRPPNALPRTQQPNLGLELRIACLVPRRRRRGYRERGYVHAGRPRAYFCDV